MKDRSGGSQGSLDRQLEALSDEQRRLFELLLREDGAIEGHDNDQIARLDPDTPKPLSYAQERIWSVSQLTPDLPVENVPVCFRLSGHLQRDALEDAVREVCSRHEILRARFKHQAGRAVQIVSKEIPHLRVLNGESVDIDWLIEQESYRLFDLADESLIRFTLVRNSKTDHVLMISTHQLLTDGFSFRLLLREISEEYRVRVQKADSTLSEPKVQYGDYASWQREAVTPKSVDDQIGYWVKQLHGLPQTVDLGDIVGGSKRPSFESANAKIRIGEDRARRLRELSRDQGVTTFMTLLAAFQVVLARAARVSDIAVGTLISNRSRHETEDLIGNFSNNLLLRLTLSDDDTFESILGRVRDTVVGAYAHQDCPFQMVAERIRHTSGAAEPAFQTMLIVRGGQESSHLVLPGISVSKVEVGFGLSRLDLSLDIVDSGGGDLAGKLEYKTAVVTAAHAKGLVENLVAILVAATDDPSVPLRSIQLPHQVVSVEKEKKSSSHAVAPASATERMLLTLWKQLFPGQDIGVCDDFFDLGGRSLGAIELTRLVGSTFNVALPISTLYHASTVREMAAHIESAVGGGARTADRQPVVQKEGYGSTSPAERRNGDLHAGMHWLVPIKPAGTRPPLFVIHGFGGGVFYFRPVARLLDADQPVYGLQSRGLEGELIPESSVEEMARLYLKEILHVQPEGPYHLTSWCVGGFVAFEIARQLLEMGKEVGVLCVLDVVAPSARREYFESRSAESGAAPYRERLMTEMQTRSDTSRLGVIWNSIGRAFRRRKRKSQLFFKVGLAQAIAASGIKVPQILRADYIRETYRRIMTSYHPPQVDVRIILVRGEESSRRSSRADLGWSDYALGGVEVVDLDMPHSEIKESPEDLARVFTENLLSQSSTQP